MVKGFKDSKGNFHPTGSSKEEFGIPRRRSTKRRSVETGVGRTLEIQMRRTQKKFPNDNPQPDPIGNISSTERWLAEKEVDSMIDEVGFDDNLFEFENKQEWWIFDKFEDAKEKAIDQERNLLESEESIVSDLAQRFPNEGFVFITETDRRIISNEDSDSIARNDGLSDSQRDELTDVIADKLESDPVDYFVNERGTHTTENLLNESFIRKDIDKMAEFVVKTDGVGHTLASYDGNEKIVKDKKGDERLYLYRAN